MYSRRRLWLAISILIGITLCAPTLLAASSDVVPLTQRAPKSAVHSVQARTAAPAPAVRPSPASPDAVFSGPRNSGGNVPSVAAPPPANPADPLRQRGVAHGPNLGEGAAAPGRTPTAPLAAPLRLLMAPADPDDPAYRAAIATLIGGTVDYFDARAGTPTAAQLSSYDCVFTWVNFQYQDRVMIGDRLADYVDAGGKVILGAFSTFAAPFGIAGRIATAGYSPVRSPAGNNHFTFSAYAGDGTTSLHAGVLAYDCQFRDFLAVQGAGLVDGHYADGEIAHAYRPDGRVVYSNGAGSAGFGGTGDWAQLISNAVMGVPSAHSILYAPSDPDDPQYRRDISAETRGPVNYFDAMFGTPSAALIATYDCVYTWANNPYQDRVTFGDRLADHVDAGNDVILGVFCTYTSGNSLGGRIMTAGYSPVTSPSGTNHHAFSSYLGDGATCLHGGVAGYDCVSRDFLIAQGAGIVDGHYADGEIAHAYRPDGRVVYSNGSGALIVGGGGAWPRLVRNACECDLSSGHRILYAPSEADDPPYRAAIAAVSGAQVDYFDAVAATPSPALLASYDCVYTWTNAAYQDRVLFGDRLANYVDAGGHVVLGEFCTYTVGNSLGGRIMTAGYSPVISPTGTNHFASSTYAGDGTTCLHHGVTAYDAIFRDFLVTQGNGAVDGRYADGEIAHAYRPDRRVIYSNGGGFSLGGTGDWPRLVANACECPVPDGVLFGCTGAGALLTMNTQTGVGAFRGNLPAGATEIEIDPVSGRAWMQARDGLFFDQQISLLNGAGIGPPVPTSHAFNGLEFLLGRLYGTGIHGGCGASDFGILDPVTGVLTAIGATGLGPISGLAFNARSSALYGVTGCGTAGPSNLVRIDVTSGAATILAGTGIRAGSLEFGPGGDLYAGGDGVDGGHLYRVNPTTGFTAMIGPSGWVPLSGLAYGTRGVVAVGDDPNGASLTLASTPNPSHGGGVRFSFTLPVSGDAELALFDIAGRRVWRSAMSALSAGPHGVTWNGRSSAGRDLGAGVYLLRLITPAGTMNTRIVRLR